MRNWLASSRATACALALLLAASSPSLAAEPGGPERLPSQQEVFQIKFRQALVRSIEGEVGGVRKISPEDRKALKDFYLDRDGQPIWIDNGRLSTSAQSAIATIGAAGDYALNPADYPLPASTIGSDATPDQLAQTEIELSLASLDYANDAHVGRINPEQVSNNIDRGSTPPNPKKVLEELAKSPDAGAALLGYHPKHPQFELLRKKYLELKAGKTPQTAAAVPAAEADDATASLDTAAVVIPRGPALQPGDRHPQVALIRQRLGAFLAPDSSAQDQASYDDVLAVAVRKFQIANALPDDGVITRDVRRALNKTAARKPPAKKEPVAVKVEFAVRRVRAHRSQHATLALDAGRSRRFSRPR